MARPRALARQPREREPAGPAPVPGPALAAVSPEPTPAQSERSPARQALALAIERVAAVEAEIREAVAAVDEARQGTFTASAAQSAAEEKLRRARPREVGGYESAPGPRSFWGSGADDAEAARRAHEDAQAPPISIAEAKAAFDAATDAYDSARRLLQHHEGRLRQATDRATMYRSNTRNAVRLVLREDPALVALAQESRRVSTLAEALRRAFGEATSGETIQPGSPYYGAGSPSWESDDPEGFAPLYAWRAAIEALASDPDAPLPLP